MFCETGVLKSFAIITGKQLLESPFNKVAGILLRYVAARENI